MSADFDFNDQGSICLLTPLTEEAQNWVADFLPDDAMRWGPAIVIEHRYAGPVLKGIQNDGLVIQ
jgi:hypothetical protein